MIELRDPRTLSDLRQRAKADSEAHLGDVQVVVQENQNEFLVASDQPSQTGGRVYVVNYEIRVPDGFEVSIMGANGNIEVGFLKDDLSILTANAFVTLDEIQASVSATVTNGDIDAEVTLPLDAVADLRVGNGDIILEIPTTTNAEFSLQITCCGWEFQNITLQNEEVSPPGVLPRTVTGTLGNGRGTISLNMGSGEVTVIGAGT